MPNFSVRTARVGVRREEGEGELPATSGAARRTTGGRASRRGRVISQPRRPQGHGGRDVEGAGGLPTIARPHVAHDAVDLGALEHLVAQQRRGQRIEPVAVAEDHAHGLPARLVGEILLLLVAQAAGALGDLGVVGA